MGLAHFAAIGAFDKILRFESVVSAAAVAAAG